MPRPTGPRSLYVCDLDGTLLGADAKLSTRGTDALSQLLDAGALITIATARSVFAVRALLPGISISLPVIELDGAFVSDLATGEHLQCRLLAPETTTAATSILLQAGFEPVLTTFDGVVDAIHYGHRQSPGTRWFVAEKRAYGDPRLRPTTDLAGVASSVPTAAVVSFAPADEAATLVDRLRAAVGPRATVGSAPHQYVTGWHEIYVRHAEADKGGGLRRLVAVSGLTGTRIVACGDHLNDLPMFAAADYCVAPANALPEVRRAADIVVPRNDQDGVVEFLLDAHAPLALAQGPARFVGLEAAMDDDAGARP